MGRVNGGGDLHHPAVEAALATAAGLVGMEVVFVGGLTDEQFSFARVRGAIPGIDEGMTIPRVDSLCHRMLEGAPQATADAATAREAWQSAADGRLVGEPVAAHGA